MWNKLSNSWKRSFELAWESYKRGTIPIGAVITDSNDKIVSEGRNRIFDKESSNPLAGTFLAHAEMTSMLPLKSKEHPDIRSYTLYTTMEPCPMCFGAIVMMNIRNIKYASRDAFAGATLLNDKSDYIKDKNISIKKADDDLEAFQLIIQTAYECERNHTRVEELIGSWAKVDKCAIELGKQLYNDQYFNKAKANNFNIGHIYNEIIPRYMKIKQTSL